jgi:hypothetical protein
MMSGDVVGNELAIVMGAASADDNRGPTN